MNLTNCLFLRSTVENIDGYEDYNVNMRNCTMVGGSLVLDHHESDPPRWYSSIRDCAFDGAAIALNPVTDGSGYDWSCFDFGYNAFSNADGTYPSGGPAEPSSDVVVTNFNWQTGPLGNYYLPNDSPAQDGTLLINAGDVTADRLGLYWFTTRTNQSINGTNFVDIGYHYPALDINGNPVSTLSNGVPDYISDPSGNGLPATWESNYFGNLNQCASELDSSGNSLLYDYQNGLDPNVIFFTLFVTNNYINTTSAPVQTLITGGIPFYYSVAVDPGTNFASLGTNWTSFASSNITATFSPTQGQHQIWVGLKGLPTNATVTWEETTVTYDSIPPTITVTNPASTVSQPMIQVQGLVNEKLSSLTFDVSNAVSVLTNQTGYASPAFFDTNLFTFTTNSFQLYDVFLTNGLNTVTIHATDLAGNAATTNFNVTLDYSGATNPVLTLVWPQDGSQVSGSNFTMEVQVDDLTAQVWASANGQSVQGQIQRNGQVRGLTLPLTAGTNAVTVTATNAAGLVSTTNINVVQSSVNLSILPLTAAQLNQSSVSVTGMVSDATQIVTVNGVQATVSGGGTWVATNVPVNPAGMATFTINAYPAGSDPTTSTPDGGLQPYQLQPPLIRLQSLEYTEYTFGSAGGGDTEDQVDYWVAGVGGASELFDNGALAGYSPFSPIASPPWNFQNWSDEHGVYDGSYEVESFYENPQTVLDTCGEGMPGTIETYPVYLGVAGYTDGVWGPLAPEDFTIQREPVIDTGFIDDFGNQWGGVLVTYPAGALLDVTPMANSPSVSAIPKSLGGDNDGIGNNYLFTPAAATLSLTVVSNTAAQINSTNWAAIMTTNTDYVIVQATVSTSNTNVANLLQWSNGLAVPGNPFQRLVSTTNSLETTVTATLGPTNTSLNVWIVWANWTEFNNTGPEDSDCDISPSALLVAGVSVWGAGVHSNNDFFNGVLMQCTISPAAFVQFTNVFYDIGQTKETQSWENTNGTWSQAGPHIGPGAPDELPNDDVDLTPLSLAHIYAADSPGFHIPNSLGSTGLLDHVKRCSFLDTAYVKLPSTVYELAISDEYAWHSISWAVWDGTNYDRMPGENEVAPGAITVGTGSSPP